MATKYWQARGDGDWNNESSWFTDPGYTTPTTVPSTGDTVHITNGTMYIGPSSPITLENVFVYQEGQLALGAGIVVTGTMYTGSSCMAPLGKTLAQTANGHLIFDVNGASLTGRLLHQGAMVWASDNISVTLTDYTLVGSEHLTSYPNTNCGVTFSKIALGTYYDYHTGFYYFAWPFDTATFSFGFTDTKIFLTQCPDPFSLSPVNANTAVNPPAYDGGPVTVIDIPIIETRRNTSPKTGEPLLYVNKDDFYPPVVVGLNIYDKFRINVTKSFGGGV